MAKRSPVVIGSTGSESAQSISVGRDSQGHDELAAIDTSGYLHIYHDGAWTHTGYPASSAKVGQGETCLFFQILFELPQESGVCPQQCLPRSQPAPAGQCLEYQLVDETGDV